MFRESYVHLNDQVCPEDTLVETTIKNAQQYEKKQQKIFFVLHKPAVMFIFICLCIFVAVPALAATVEPVYRLMYLVSPSVAQFFMPVQISDENNGIKMEVVSAFIHENTAEIYITMQDLTGDRIDDSIDLYDSYSIHRPFDSSSHCEFIGYDKDTKKATFLITIDEWGSKEIAGDKITFSVGEFISRKNDYKDIEIPIDLSAVSIAENTQIVSSNGGGGHDYEDFINFEKHPIALVPQTPMPQFPINGFELTGIGYIDGKLHIQIAEIDPLSRDNHGYFYLKDDKGTIINANFSFSFSNQFDKPEDRIDYENDVFAISQDELTNYTLHGDFITYGLNTKGNWRVTFPLEKEKV